MSPSTKRIVLIAAGFLLISAVTIGAMGAYIFDRGMLVVQVREEGGDDVCIRIPAILVQSMIAVIPDQVFDEARSEAGEEFHKICPAVRAMWRELDDLPDFVLVEVSSRDEQVSVRKQGGRLVVHVDSPREHVHVVVPLGMVDSILGKLDRAA